MMALGGAAAQQQEPEEPVDHQAYGILEEIMALGRDGYMLIDSGATSHVAGVGPAEDLQRAASHAGLGKSSFDTTSKKNFSFGNGATGTTTGTALIPATATGDSAPLPVSIMDAAAPPLLGVNLLNDTEAIVNFGPEPSITFWGGRGPTYPLMRLASGHLAHRVIGNEAAAIFGSISADDLKKEADGNDRAEAGASSSPAGDSRPPGGQQA